MKQLPPRDLPAWLDEQRTAGVDPLLLDVREPWETALVRIDQSGTETLAIPMQQVPARLAELDPDRPVVCYCHHGMRSLQVALFLESRGFDEVCNLAGGIDAWAADVDPTLPRY